MEANQDWGVGNTPFLVIFTDLDGTLLDRKTYSWEEAVQALDSCRRSSVPVILASSKTGAEMEVIRRRLSLSDPYISENGGAVFFPVESFRESPPGGDSGKGALEMVPRPAIF